MITRHPPGAIIVTPEYLGVKHDTARALIIQVVLAPSAHRSFFYKSEDHGTLFGEFASRPDLIPFLTDQLTGSGSWPSYTP